MAVIGNTYPGLADVLKREDPNHKIAAIIELLNETNEILDDAITVEGNLPTGHRTTVRTGLPTATWRKLYGGVIPTKSTTKQVDDTCGMLEAYAEVDKALADLNGNTAAFRLSESVAHVEAMNQQMAQALIYGDTDVNPERYLGLSERFNVISTDSTKSGYNIINAAGAGADNTSMWFVTWGDTQTHLTYPKGSMAGLQHTDKGQVTAGDSTNGYYEAYRDHFKWDIGLVVRDWRGVSRIANIDVSLVAAGSVALEDFMIDAYYKIRKRPGKKAIYCSESMMVGLHKRAKDKANVQLSLDTFAGKQVVSFLGIPIREVDAILETESVIS